MREKKTKVVVSCKEYLKGKRKNTLKIFTPYESDNNQTKKDFLKKIKKSLNFKLIRTWN